MSGRRARILPAALIVLVAAACGEPAGPHLPDVGEADSVELHLGSSCRRLEVPGQVAALVELAGTLGSGWEPFWGTPEPPNVVLVYLREDDRLLALGIDSGQLFVVLDERSWFRPGRDGAPKRLIDAAGGLAPAPTATTTPCRSTSELGPRPGGGDSGP